MKTKKKKSTATDLVKAQRVESLVRKSRIFLLGKIFADRFDDPIISRAIERP